MRTRNSRAIVLLGMIWCAGCASTPKELPASPPAGTITARNISIVDAQGRERIQLGGELLNGRPALVFNYTNGEPAITCALVETDLSTEGDDAYAHDAAALILEAPGRNVRVVAGATESGASVSVDWLSRVSFSITTSEDRSVLEIAPMPPDDVDESDGPIEPAYFIRIVCDAKGVPQIELRDASGQKLITAH